MQTAQNKMIGIDDKAFNDLILKFLKIKEELNETFNNFNSLVDSLESCYVSAEGRELIKKYHEFADSNFNTVLDNLSSYVTDLKTARGNLDVFDSKLLLQITEDKIATIVS